MKQVMRRGYCKKYTEYICVDTTGEIIKPDYVTDHFKVVLKENELKSVSLYDLRHPHVKPTAKNIPEKQKPQTINRFDGLGFLLL